jgi:tRNA(Ile)-lysidine synthase
MPRSHPPSLLTLARAALGRGGLAPRGSTVLAAVSGGPDSMALLHVLAKLRTPIGFRLVAHGVDHGLRPEARRELDVAEEMARSLEVPFERTRVALEAGGNLQARARQARYAALGRAATIAGAGLIATAHHADDRAETVLLRLLRGSGPAGLAVLPSRAPLPGEGVERRIGLTLIRPFLRARRADIDADPSNRDPRFLRTRVRHELLPLLARLSPRIVEHLCALADALGQTEAGRSGAPYGPGLSRATRVALEELARTRSTKARVRLPGGLEVGLRVAPKVAQAEPPTPLRDAWPHRDLDVTHRK